MAKGGKTRHPNVDVFESIVMMLVQYELRMPSLCTKNRNEISCAFDCLHAQNLISFSSGCIRTILLGNEVLLLGVPVPTLVEWYHSCRTMVVKFSRNSELRCYCRCLFHFNFTDYVSFILICNVWMLLLPPQLFTVLLLTIFVIHTVGRLL